MINTLYDRVSCLYTQPVHTYTRKRFWTAR